MISPTVLAKPENFLAQASKSSGVARPAAVNADMFPGRRGSDVRSAASKPFVSLTTVTLRFELKCKFSGFNFRFASAPLEHPLLVFSGKKSQSSFLDVLLVISVFHAVLIRKLNNEDCN